LESVTSERSDTTIRIEPTHSAKIVYSGAICEPKFATG